MIPMIKKKFWSLGGQKIALENPFFCLLDKKEINTDFFQLKTATKFGFIQNNSFLNNFE
jgi:hypothetical protein